MSSRPDGKTQTDGETKTEDPPSKQRIKKRRTKETHPTPGRKPSSESYYSSGESESDGPKEDLTATPLALHEDLHEELYGLPTPKKPSAQIVHGDSSEITATELEGSPGADESSSSEKDDEKPRSGNTTGKHKDRTSHSCIPHSLQVLFASCRMLTFFESIVL